MSELIETFKRAEVVETIDTKYKAGRVQCVKCGWEQELGDGFNVYKIDMCPDCQPHLETRNQRKVTTGTPGKQLKVELGLFRYFVISNGIHLQYSKSVSSTHYCVTESQADRY